MKLKTSILLLVSGFIFAALYSCNGSGATNSQPIVNTSGSNYKIAVVNRDSLIAKYNYYIDVKGALDSKRSQASDQIKNRRAALEREFNDYQRNANNLTADQRAIAEQRLMRKNEDFQKFAQDLDKSTSENEGLEFQKLQTKINAFLEQYAKSNGYQFVLAQGQGSSLLFADETFDVTADVISALNAEYDKK